MEQEPEQITPKKRKRYTPLHIAFAFALLIICLSLSFLIYNILSGSLQPTLEPTQDSSDSSNSSVSISSGQIAREQENLESYSAAGPPMNISGDGDSVTDEFSLPSPFSRATFTNTGSGAFIVKAYFGGEQDLLVDAVGNYQGSILIRSAEPVYFDIKSDSTWSVVLEGVGKTASSMFTGEGDNVSGFFISPGKSTCEISHTGESSFIVRVHCIGGSDLVVNKIGDYTGSSVVSFSYGPCLWEVKSEGRWTILPR